MSQEKRPKRQEFVVAIEGTTLTKEQAERINEVVQKAVLTELAALNLGKGFRTRWPPFTIPGLPYPVAGMIINIEFGEGER